MLLLFLFRLFPVWAQTWIPRTETRFDFSRLRRLESGPTGHVYALDEKMNLALIRFDTIKRNSNQEIIAAIVSVLPLQYWTGFENEHRSFDFSSVSGDGRHLALSLSSRKILRRDADGSAVYAPAREEIFVLDFPARKLEFRAETGKKTSSVFFGQTLRYRDARNGKVRIMAKDPEETRPRILRDVPKDFPADPGRHLSLSNQGFSASDEFLVSDPLLELQYRLQANTLLIEKTGYSARRIPLNNPAEIELFRYRGGVLLLSDSGKTAAFILPGNLDEQQVPIREEGGLAVDYRSCLLNSEVIVGFSKSCFTFTSLSNGKRSKSRPVPAAGTAEVPLAGMNGAAGFLSWPKSGKIYRFLPVKREFSMQALQDTAGLQFPCLNSRNFRLRSTRFIGDSSKSKEDSRFAPGIFLNGTRIASSYGASPTEFIRLDVSEKAGRAFLSYCQPRILALSQQIKTVWAADNSSPILALRADAEGKSLFSWSESGIVDFWNAETGKKYLSLLFDSSGKEWLLWTPAGFFDSSPGGATLLNWLPPAGKEQFPGLFSLAFFEPAFRKPELVDAVLLCRDEATALKRLKIPFGEVNQKTRLALRPPHIYLEFPGDKINFNGQEVSIPYFETPGRMPLKKIQLLLNGKALPDYLPDGKDLIRLNPPENDVILELIPYSAAGPGEKVVCRLYRQNP